MALGFGMAERQEDPQIARRDAMTRGRGVGFGAGMPNEGPGTVARATDIVRKAGRREDDELAHVAQGEIILPHAFQQANPGLMPRIRQAFVDAGLDPDRYIVADTDGPNHRITGLEEFWSGEGDSDNDGDGVGGGPGDSGMGGGTGPGGSENAGHSTTDAEGEHAGAKGPSGRTGAEASAGQQADAQAAENAAQGADPGSAADRVVSFIAKTLTYRVGKGLEDFNSLMSGVNQAARARGISVVDGTGYGGPPGSPSPSAPFGGGDDGNDVGGSTDDPRAPASRKSTADQPSTVKASAPAGVGFAMAPRPNVNPRTGAQQFFSANEIDPRTGVTYGFTDEAAYNAWKNSQTNDAGRNSISQEQALADNPGKTMKEIKDDAGMAAAAPGGINYQHAIDTGKNDPTSDPANPQPFSVSTLKSVGADPQAYFDKNTAQNAGANAFVDFGANPDFNRKFVSWLRAQGYDLPFNDIGEGQAQAWIQGLPDADRAKVEAWLDANSPNRQGDPPTVGGIQDPNGNGPGGIVDDSTIGSTSVAGNLNAILASDSPLMQRARTAGLQFANKRGLLNSSIAGEAAQNAMIDAALPIASQDADISNQQTMQQRDIQLQQWLQRSDADLRRALQDGELGNQRWIATLDADTRKQIADLQVGTADREKIGAMIASAQSNYTSQYEAILNNTSIPADERANNLAHIRNLMNSSISLIEQTYGVDLTWDPATGVVSGA